MSSSMDRIEHIVVLMLENRSFDNLLGWIYTDDLPEHNIPPLRSGERAYHGLAGLDLKEYTNKVYDRGTLVMSQEPVHGAVADDVPQSNPHERYPEVNVQLFGVSPPADQQPATMLGFLQDYAGHWDRNEWYNTATQSKIRQIMQTYDRKQVPTLAGLARHYAVSDLFFSSVPTNTNPNRAFFHCGTSLGRAVNKHLSTVEQFPTRTIWNVLAEHKISWDVFYSGKWWDNKCYTQYTFPFVDQIPDASAHFQPITEFYRRAHEGNLARFTFLEPAWYLLVKSGNDMHPPTHVLPSDKLVANVVNALQFKQAAWEKTLLVVTFDEHGGTFDHYPPPWGAAHVGQPDPFYGYGFRFNRFGVRVPTVLVSPWIAARTVFRSEAKTPYVPYDLTSITATILTWAGIPKTQWGLGARVDAAPTFGNVLTLTSPRKVDPSPDDVQFDSDLYIQHESGLFVVGMDDGTKNWAQLGSHGMVVHRLTSGAGTLKNGTTCRIKSTQAELGDHNTLGKFNKTYLYYWSSDYSEQNWTAQKDNDEPHEVPIRYREWIRIINDDNHEDMHRRDDDGKPYLSTNDKAEHWRLVRRPGSVPGDVVTASDPALCVYRDQLWLAFRDHDATQLRYAIFDGESWDTSSSHRVPGAGISAGPTMAVHEQRLFFAWRGSGDGNLYFQWFDGSSWRSRQQGTPFKPIGGPALGTIEDRLVAFWTKSDKTIAYSFYDPAKDTFEGEHPVGTSSVTSEPTLATLDRMLYVSWQQNSGPLHTKWYDGSWLGEVTARWSSGSAPGMAAYASRLHMLFRDTGPGTLSWHAEWEGSKWGDQAPPTALVDMVGRPAMAEYRGSLYLAYRRDGGGPQLIYFVSVL